MKEIKYYVTMIDKSMSGWGKAEGKKNYVIFGCDNREEAEILKSYAKTREEMTDIKIRTRKPRPSERLCFVSNYTKETAPYWYRSKYE